EVGDVAEHQPDPGALLEPHGAKLLRAPIDPVEQPAPGQVVVPVDEGLVVAAGVGGALEPVVEKRHGDTWRAPWNNLRGCGTLAGPPPGGKDPSICFCSCCQAAQGRRDRAALIHPVPSGYAPRP